ncbi:hypothetical protein C2845_PM16G09410 [Panicum miliaceum]|uniref:Uncharacterized protein n=1 Tax=Panicum miliaceum TaxID=4540 RepID=A0A3L6PXU2_PANMI|nr:hypothetical protein C2845_PM16G09410 [Panicum miliaceum]
MGVDRKNQAADVESLSHNYHLFHATTTPCYRRCPSPASTPVPAARRSRGLGTAAMSGDVPVLFSDGETLKRELVAWAKAVASVAGRESTQLLPC